MYLILASVIVGVLTLLLGEVKSGQIEAALIDSHFSTFEEINTIRGDVETQAEEDKLPSTEDSQNKPKDSNKKPTTKTDDQESESNLDYQEYQASNTSTTTRPVETNKKPAPKIVSSVNPTSLEVSSSLSYINNLRASAGKSGLTLNSTMNSWANSWAQKLANDCELNHQELSNFLGKNIGPTTTSSIAENVGYNTSINSVLNGLKNSPGHYNNMIGNYKYVGVGVVKAGSGWCKDYIFTTQLFAK